MLAMQYSFTLPADYDMRIIHRRIADKGHLTDNFPQLRCKAFLHASRGAQSRENLYAPFYLWDDAEGMNNFLAGSGFAALVQAFGWPVIRTWSVWHARLMPNIRSARCATREVVAIPPYTNLSELREAERLRLDADIDQRGALGAAVAFEPTTWTVVRFRLWPSYSASLLEYVDQVYELGHLSLPGYMAES
jgi:hypothetical protein